MAKRAADWGPDDRHPRRDADNENQYHSDSGLFRAELDFSPPPSTAALVLLVVVVVVVRGTAALVLVVVVVVVVVRGAWCVVWGASLAVLPWWAARLADG
ncbi:hypothetical protein T484DRAFT_1765286 [Baffinella frigidus]|nr:hypothetical protein T484DRAFT_1765286 [Cryptophyta sp. CCMP2293]